MKLTTSRLKQIIQEEAKKSQKSLAEGMPREHSGAHGGIESLDKAIAELSWAAEEFDAASDSASEQGRARASRDFSAMSNRINDLLEMAEDVLSRALDISDNIGSGDR